MSDYKDQKESMAKSKATKMIINDLPWFCHKFFEERRDLAGSSRVKYCYELNSFFEYLHTNSYFDAKDISKYELSDLGKITKADIQKYFTYLESHLKPQFSEVENPTADMYTGAGPATMKRTKACLSGFWNYFIENDLLVTNPLAGIRLGKITETDPVVLNQSEKERLLDAVKNGTGLYGKKLENHEQSMERDYAIAYLFLHTGMRVSELVGLDVSDIDFYSHSAHVERKGHKEEDVYFSDAAEAALTAYLEVRHEKYSPVTTDALFLNKYGERMTERSVERMLKKYVAAAMPAQDKKISPHKLRSTYATDMLNATGNIELVSKQLGHAKISTTQVYAKSSKEKRAEVRNIIQ